MSARDSYQQNGHEYKPSKDCSARIRAERLRCPTVLSSIPSIAYHDPSLYYSQYYRSVNNQKQSYFAAILLAVVLLNLDCGVVMLTLSH
jgi:hypothetical protein